MSGKGIGVGSTLAELRDAYGTLPSRPDRYVHGGRQYFLRRSRASHWELRFDVGIERYGGSHLCIIASQILLY